MEDALGHFSLDLALLLLIRVVRVVNVLDLVLRQALTFGTNADHAEVSYVLTLYFGEAQWIDILYFIFITLHLIHNSVNSFDRFLQLLQPIGVSLLNVLSYLRFFVFHFDFVE